MRRRHLLLGSLSSPLVPGSFAHAAEPVELFLVEDPPYAAAAGDEGGPVPMLVRAMLQLLGHSVVTRPLPADALREAALPPGALVAPLRPGYAPRSLTPLIELLAVPRAFATLFHGSPRHLSEAARLGLTGVRAGSDCEATLREAGFRAVMPLPDAAALAETLRAGSIAAWYGEVPVMRRAAMRLDLPLLIGPAIGRVPLWLAGVEPRPGLAGRLADAYGVLQAEGTVEALLGAAVAS